MIVLKPSTTLFRSALSFFFFSLSSAPSFPLACFSAKRRCTRGENFAAPFLRPKNLSRSNSNEIDFVKHALKYLKKRENYTPDIVVRMLATVPFQKTKDIDKLIELILNKKYESAVIVSKAKQHPRKALKISFQNI